jgi:hypothetical protein
MKNIRKITRRLLILIFLIFISCKERSNIKKTGENTQQNVVNISTQNALKIDENYVRNEFEKSKFVEYEKIKDSKVFISDLDGDNINDAILEFKLVQLENINDIQENQNCIYTSGIVLYLNSGEKLIWSDMIREMKRGGQPIISVVKIDKGIIYTNSKSFKENDSLCCPTFEKKYEYVVRNKELKIK